MLENDRVVAASLVFIAAVASCGRNELVGAKPEGQIVAAPSEVDGSAPEHVAGHAVQVGTDFTLTMLSGLSSDTAREGQLFTARIDDDLRATDGTVVVPAGAIVKGRVARVGGEAAPSLALAFDTVETPWGEASLSAKLEGAERMRVPGTNEVYDPSDPSSADYDALFFPPFATPYTPGAAPPPVGGLDYYDAKARRIAIPKGARLSVELTQPILPSVR